MFVITSHLKSIGADSAIEGTQQYGSLVQKTNRARFQIEIHPSTAVIGLWSTSTSLLKRTSVVTCDLCEIKDT